jgi:Domain of unknown function (DUF4286)
MFLYNVTVKIDAAIASEWLAWMRNTHIPDVLRTELFVANRICRLIDPADDDDGATFAIQYTFRAMADLQRYQNEYAPALQKDHTDRYAGRFVAFRTVLEIVE